MADLELTEEQIALQETARDFLTRRMPTTRVRELEKTELGYSPELWAEMAGLEWLKLGLDPEQGGVGGGLVDLTLLYFELGRTLMTSPHLYSAVLARDMLAEFGGPHATALLPEVIAGTKIVIPALMEADGLYGKGGIELKVESRDGNPYVSGSKVLVPFANSASHFLVPARDDSGAIRVLLVEAKQPGVSLVRLANIGSFPLYSVHFSVALDGSAFLDDGRNGWEVLSKAIDVGCVLRSAEIAGAGEGLLDLCVNYALSRKQFGGPVGRFQAVQYLCSDIAIGSHMSRLFAISAGGLADERLPFDEAARMAKAYASRASRKMAHAGHEVFAGLGYMMECDVQLFSRRMKHWELDLGDDTYYLRQLGKATQDSRAREHATILG
jgi:3-oxocholest-4-en-26-oyl-CoA dehydrogenase beta subunit